MDQRPPTLDVPGKGELTEDRLDLGRRKLTLLRPADADVLLDALLEEDEPSEDDLPFWAEQWPSGVALARELLTRDLAGVEALELGCGLGLVSVAAAAAGADVLATDWSTDALAFTAANAARNGVQVRTARRAWGDPGDLVERAPWALVLAADVLYELRNVDLLLGLLGRLVEPGRGEVLLADPGRPPWAVFDAGLATGGWLVTELPTPIGGVTLRSLRRPAS
jgi:predicted nicotinamide N-methyase